MLDIGWSELFLVAVVTVLAIGPAELPRVMRALGRITRRLHYLRFAISQQIDDLMKDEEDTAPPENLPDPVDAIEMDEGDGSSENR